MHTYICISICIACVFVCLIACQTRDNLATHTKTRSYSVTHTCILYTHTHTAAVEQFHFICKLSFFEYHIRFFLFSRPNAFKISGEILFCCLSFSYTCVRLMHVCIFVLTCVRMYIYFNQCCQNSQIIYKKANCMEFQ